MEQEVWKDIWFKKWINYTWLYKINNMGIVKSLPKYKWVIYQKELIRKTILNKFWYELITLSNNKTTRTFLIHRLVAQVFIPNPENKPQVNHINWIKNDNRVENLEWMTSKENIKHSWESWFNKNNTMFHNNPSKWKLWWLSIHSKKVNQYTMDGIFIKTWESIVDIKKEIWLTMSWIIQCCRGKNWYAHNYQWEYFNWNTHNIWKINTKWSKKVAKLDKNFNTIQIYNSIKEAAIKNNIHSSSIWQVCIWKRKTAGWYNWKYI